MKVIRWLIPFCIASLISFGIKWGYNLEASYKDVFTITLWSAFGYQVGFFAKALLNIEE